MRRTELHGINRWAVERLLEDVQSRHQFTELELKQLLAFRFEQPLVSLYVDLLPEAVDGDLAARVKLVNSMRHTEMQALLVAQSGGDGNRSLVAFKSSGELTRAAGLPATAS